MNTDKAFNASRRGNIEYDRGYRANRTIEFINDYTLTNVQRQNYSWRKEVGCQCNPKSNNIMYSSPMRAEVVYYSGLQKQVYDYSKTRSFTNVGVGSVNPQKKRVRKIYLPETEHRGVGSTDLSSFIADRKTRYERENARKRISSKCVGGAIIKAVTVNKCSEKLSPINIHNSKATNPNIDKEVKTISKDIGNNTIEKNLANTTTQVENPDQEEVYSKKNSDTIKVMEPVNAVKSARYSTNTKYQAAASMQKSSDSLEQHVHNLEDPSFIQSTGSSDPMENKLEKEYRKIFCNKNKEDTKLYRDKPVNDLKSASLLRRRFEALKRGMAKKEETKKSTLNASKPANQDSGTPIQKDISVESDPPSLEAKSYSHTKIFSPPPSVYKHDRRSRHTRKKSPTDKQEKVTPPLKDKVDDSDVKGMFKMWEEKFNFEDEKKADPIGVTFDTKPKEIKTKGNEPKSENEDKTEGKRFFFFKKKNKEKDKPAGDKKGVTTGRCEVKNCTILNRQDIDKYILEKKSKNGLTKSDEEDIIKKNWLKNFIQRTIESRKSLQIRWNNKTYKTSSSTMFELMDNMYRQADVVIRTQSEASTISSYYPSYHKHRVNFVQDVEAWMVPNMMPHRNVPYIFCRNDDNRISDRKWFIDKSKAFAHEIELLLNSKNFARCHRTISSDYLRIDIPKGFFTDPSTDSDKFATSNSEEVYKVIEYESPESRSGLRFNVKNNKGDYSYDDVMKQKVSVRDKNTDTRVVETVIKKPPAHRDVVIQGSNVHIPKRCDVIGVGIITHRVNREIGRPLLNRDDDDSGEESEQIMDSKLKQCQFAESYLREYYSHWMPLGMDLFPDRVSDFHIKCESQDTMSSLHNQGDGTKSCPNIPNDYHSEINFNPSSNSQGSCKESYIDKTKIFNTFKSTTKSDPPVDVAKRVLPKDSFEVLKKRMLYACGNRSRWNYPDDQPYSVPSIQDKGEQDALNDPSKMLNKCGKRVSMTKCNFPESCASGESKPVGILSYNKKSLTSLYTKRATLKEEENCIILPPTCSDHCNSVPNPKCSKQTSKTKKESKKESKKDSKQESKKKLPSSYVKISPCPIKQIPSNAPCKKNSPCRKYSEGSVNEHQCSCPCSLSSNNIIPKPPQPPSNQSKTRCSQDPMNKCPKIARACPCPLKKPQSPTLSRQSSSGSNNSNSSTSEKKRRSPRRKSPSRSKTPSSCCASSPQPKPPSSSRGPSSPKPKPSSSCCPPPPKQKPPSSTNSSPPKPKPPSSNCQPKQPSSGGQSPPQRIPLSSGCQSPPQPPLSGCQSPPQPPLSGCQSPPQSMPPSLGCLSPLHPKPPSLRSQSPLQPKSPSSLGETSPQQKPPYSCQSPPQPKSPSSCGKSCPQRKPPKSGGPSPPRSKPQSPKKQSPRPKSPPCGPICPRIKPPPPPKGQTCPRTNSPLQCGKMCPITLTPCSCSGCFEKSLESLNKSPASTQTLPKLNTSSNECVPCPVSPCKKVRSQSKMPGVHLKMKPAPKCDINCPADKIIETRTTTLSEEQIMIRVKESSASTEEIREAVNIKVQDADGKTLYERRDYKVDRGIVAHKSSLLGDVYNVNTVSTASVDQLPMTDSDMLAKSISNLIEISFGLKITQGEKLAEISLNGNNNEAHKVNKNCYDRKSQDIMFINNEAEVTNEADTNDKNDINIKIVIKNFDTKTAKPNRKHKTEKFAKQISQKFHTVSTGYSDILGSHIDDMYSMHKTTIDLTDSKSQPLPDSTKDDGIKENNEILPKEAEIIGDMQITDIKAAKQRDDQSIQSSKTYDVINKSRQSILESNNSKKIQLNNICSSIQKSTSINEKKEKYIEIGDNAGSVVKVTVCKKGSESENNEKKSNTDENSYKTNNYKQIKHNALNESSGILIPELLKSDILASKKGSQRSRASRVENNVEDKSLVRKSEINIALHNNNGSIPVINSLSKNIDDMLKTDEIKSETEKVSQYSRINSRNDSNNTNKLIESFETNPDNHNLVSEMLDSILQQDKIYNYAGGEVILDSDTDNDMVVSGIILNNENCSNSDKKITKLQDVKQQKSECKETESTKKLKFLQGFYKRFALKETKDDETINKLPSDKVQRTMESDKNTDLESENEHTDLIQSHKSLRFSDTDEQDTIQELTNTSDDGFDSTTITKSLTKRDKKEMLKTVFEKASSKKWNTKGRMQRLKNVLKFILTSDSSDVDDVAISSKDLVKDMSTCSTYEQPALVKNTDSMNNYYRIENVLHSEDEMKTRDDGGQDQSEYTDSSDYQLNINKCLCNTMAERLRERGEAIAGGCCCKPPLVNTVHEQTSCNMNKDNIFMLKTAEYIDVQTQNSIINSRITNFQMEKVLTSTKCSPFGNTQEDHSVSPFIYDKECELKNVKTNTVLGLLDDSQIVIRTSESKQASMKAEIIIGWNTKDKKKPKESRKASFATPADILQCYETKKAVLEIYTEKTVTKEGERLVAKLPKFVYDKESDIERNYGKNILLS